MFLSIEAMLYDCSLAYIMKYKSWPHIWIYEVNFVHYKCNSEHKYLENGE